MHRFYVEKDQISEDEIVIRGSDVNHIKNVLRMRPGDDAVVSCSEDEVYQCAVRRFEDQQVVMSILWKIQENVELPVKITLFQSLPKMDKMELIIQKAVELGAAGIVPVSSARCVVKLSSEKASSRVARWNAISQSAAKQARRGYIPHVADICSFDRALEIAGELDRIIIPYERAEDMEKTRELINSIKPGESLGIFIGPEGGFERYEVEKAIAAGAHPITLGRRILRTETAGMALLSALMIALEGRERKTGTT